MSDTNKKYNLLFVDDEKRILTSLRSIFRRDYNVYIANGGGEALDILSKNTIDVIVSDQRMPNMLGNELLAQVHKLYPKTMRLLLTGFMDKEAIIRTINEGEIYRFINKPWRNDDIQNIIAEAAQASEFESAVETVISDTPAVSSIPDDTVPANTGTPSNKDQAILMMGNSQELRNQIRSFCKSQHIAIYGTQNISQAISTVAARPNVGVNIIELPANTNEVIQAISLLKEKRPDLISIVLTEQTDAETAVDLINSGQVFRYLAKPLETEQLAKVVQQAFARHAFLKGNAQAQQRYKVAAPKGTMASGLKELFSSFGLLRKQT